MEANASLNIAQAIGFMSDSTPSGVSIHINDSRLRSVTEVTLVLQLVQRTPSLYSPSTARQSHPGIISKASPSYREMRRLFNLSFSDMSVMLYLLTTNGCVSRERYSSSKSMMLR